MKQFLLLILLFSPPSFANDCQGHYNEYEKKLGEMEDAAKATAVAEGAASFFGPIATITATAIGAGVVLALQKEADKHLARYKDCQRNREEENQRTIEENRQKYLQEQEEKKNKEEQEKNRLKQEREGEEL
ncbi:MAG: hypothetical protein KA436_10020 [Oligoflexales bacterium]|nr:hypothetical protein [Oligoflexales bacterium]